MARVVWLTDLHFNFLEPDGVRAFLDRVAGLRPDAVLLCGDVGEAPDLCETLEAIDDRWQTPVCFVLGNHDFYRGSIAELCSHRPRLCT